MKQVFIGVATILATFAQIYFIGINGLTLISLPITIYLGIEVIEKLTETEEDTI